MVPSDYDDPDKTDSDNRGDPNYSQEDEDVAQLFPSPRVHLTRSRNRENLGSTPDTTQRENSAEAIPAAASGPPAPTLSQETPAPDLSQQSSEYRRAQREITIRNRDLAFEKAERIMLDARNRITDPGAGAEADEEITAFRTWRRRRVQRLRTNNGRKKPSVMWNHVVKDPVVDVIKCQHCDKQ